MREVTQEHPKVLEEYANLKNAGEPVTSVKFHYVFDLAGPVSHGDEVELQVIAELPDGSLTDFTFPERLIFTANLWACDEQTAGFLSWITRTWKPQVVFETGTNRGRSTKAIADSLELNGSGHITTVDLADHRVEERLPRTTFVQGDLPGALDEKPLTELDGIEMAFLDGPHYEDEVTKEFEYVKARVSKRGCYVLFDDARNGSWLGVNTAVTKLPGHCILPSPRGLGVVFLEGTP